MIITNQQKKNINIIMAIALNCNIKNLKVTTVDKIDNKYYACFKRILDKSEQNKFMKYFKLNNKLNSLNYKLSIFNDTYELTLLDDNHQYSIFEEDYIKNLNKYELLINTKLNNICKTIKYDKSFLYDIIDTSSYNQLKSYKYVLYSLLNNYCAFAANDNYNTCSKSESVNIIPDSAKIYDGNIIDAICNSLKRSYNSLYNINWSVKIIHEFDA